MLFVLIVFVGLLIVGIKLQELAWSHVVLFILTLVAVSILVGVFRLPPVFLTALLALLDIVLVLMIFKGDISI